MHSQTANIEIHNVHAGNASLYRGDLNVMFEQRARIFVGRKQWNLKVTDGQERDVFDDIPAVEYLLIKRGTDVLGSTRLLPGDCPNTCNRALKHFFTMTPPPQAADCYEVSRTILAEEGSWAQIAPIHAIGHLGLIEWAVNRQAKRLFAVTDDRFVGAIQHFGCEVDLHGMPISYPEGGKGVAVSWPISERLLEVTREVTQIWRSVLVTLDAQTIQSRVA